MPHLVLPPQQRRNFRAYAGYTTAPTGPHDTGTLVEVLLRAGLLLAVTGYHRRVAAGRAADKAGPRTKPGHGPPG
ncbi:hypothetical protein ACWT_4278 [Actinoplanes sp. SE50]|uniref:hypothetical protein n=1 Tax=unclassified Actinoplanes TaxID=2626549 RepID=UPI00023EC64A|nr:MULTISPECIES: hypothetical protein [unclassified Actinoplanes]AEV85298.1 hypothetical protein ACPL_4407 [Actinoplanes sp. SE50/110]ATO83693.1 hypothetical protein ACWT_4278 [Actinoplanes sp. SE50]SLM01101.1 hypothetical protein ACSP50_4334 [Actinoplanes sp. SE50/110]